MDEQKVSIVVFSGDFDRAIAAFTIATGAAATNRPVDMFFTFWGLNILKKKFGRSPVGKSFLARIFNVLMGGRNKLPLSRLNFCGQSPKLMTGMMKKQNVATLAELIDSAHSLGVRLIACEMAMHILEIERDDLVEQVREVIDVATFLDYSQNAKIFFI